MSYITWATFDKDHDIESLATTIRAVDNVRSVRIPWASDGVAAIAVYLIEKKRCASHIKAVMARCSGVQFTKPSNLALACKSIFAAPVITLRKSFPCTVEGAVAAAKEAMEAAQAKVEAEEATALAETQKQQWQAFKAGLPLGLAADDGATGTLRGCAYACELAVHHTADISAEGLANKLRSDIEQLPQVARCRVVCCVQEGECDTWLLIAIGLSCQSRLGRHRNRVAGLLPRGSVLMPPLVEANILRFAHAHAIFGAAMSMPATTKFPPTGEGMCRALNIPMPTGIGAKGGEGIAFEIELASAIAATNTDGRYTHVGRITKRNEQGNQGGDILIVDASGRKAIIEAKNKANLSDYDFHKFVRDVRDGDADVYIFVRKGGVGNSRVLAQQPDCQVLHGKAVYFNKGSELNLLTRLPTMIVQGVELVKAAREVDELREDLQRARKRLRTQQCIIAGSCMIGQSTAEPWVDVSDEESDVDMSPSAP